MSSQRESVIANLVTSGTKDGAIAASASQTGRRFGIGVMALAILLATGAVAALEYFGNARLRASVETTSEAARSANQALAKLQAEMGDLRVSLDRSGRRGDEIARLQDIRDALAGLQRRLAEIETAHGGALERLGQRLDADESRQTEASEKLAGLGDDISRLEGRIDATASSVAQKQDDRPASVDGWRVVELAGHRAIVRNPAGRLYEVSTGSEVPGLGMIENIRRAGKRVSVVTQRGVITAVLESRP